LAQKLYNCVLEKWDRGQVGKNIESKLLSILYEIFFKLRLIFWVVSKFEPIRITDARRGDIEYLDQSQLIKLREIPWLVDFFQ
jgi:hypothetical protein